MFVGPEKSVEIEVQADTGSDVTVFNSKVMEHLDWMQLENTNVQLKAFDGRARRCLGAAVLQLQRGKKTCKDVT